MSKKVVCYERGYDTKSLGSCGCHGTRWSTDEKDTIQEDLAEICHVNSETPFENGSYTLTTGGGSVHISTSREFPGKSAQQFFGDLKAVITSTDVSKIQRIQLERKHTTGKEPGSESDEYQYKRVVEIERMPASSRLPKELSDLLTRHGFKKRKVA